MITDHWPVSVVGWCKATLSLQNGKAEGHVQSCTIVCIAGGNVSCGPGSTGLTVQTIAGRAVWLDHRSHVRGFTWLNSHKAPAFVKLHCTEIGYYHQNIKLLHFHYRYNKYFVKLCSQLLQSKLWTFGVSFMLAKQHRFCSLSKNWFSRIALCQTSAFFANHFQFSSHTNND